MRIVFMGTPDIAATCLRRILEDGFQVCSVFTKPDAAKNRGMQLTPPPVKEVALTYNIPVYQPERIRQENVTQLLRDLAPDVIAVVAYGKILPAEILNIPSLGCINIHASILPELRGSAPVQWAILNGMEETGVTAMYMAPEMDAGDVIEIRRLAIDPEENSSSLMNRLAVVGAGLLSDTLARLEHGPVPGIPQDAASATFAPMLSKELSPINWNKTAGEICNQIRGLDPWPVATAVVDGTSFKIYRAAVLDARTDRVPGSLLALSKTGLQVACGEGTVLEIRVLQAAGGKRMDAPAYFRGHPIAL